MRASVGDHHDAPERHPNLLAFDIRFRLSAGFAARFRVRQCGRPAMPVRGPADGRFLGVRSVAAAGHLFDTNGSVSVDGRIGFGQSFSLLSQGDEHDVRRRFGDRHRRRTLQTPHASCTIRH